MNIEESEHLRIEPLGNNTFRFDFLDDSPKAVDKLFDALIKITESSEPDTTNRYLLVAGENENINISQTIKRANIFFRRYSRRPFSRTAVVHRGGYAVQMVYKYIQGMNKHDVVKFFSLDEEDKAKEWLMS